MTGPEPTGRPGDDHEQRMSSKASRRRGRILLPAIFLGVIALIFLFMLTVGQLGR